MGQWSSPPGAIINKPRRKRTSATGSGVDGEEEMDAATDWYSVQYRTIEWKQQYKDSQYLRRDSECSIVHFAKGNNRRQSNAKSRLQLNKSVCLLHLPMVVITLDCNYCQFLIESNDDLRPEQLASQFTIYQMACILAPEHTCSCIYGSVH
jgi:hypothetical protein